MVKNSNKSLIVMSLLALVIMAAIGSITNYKNWLG
jgi:hypothetical protein